MLGLVTFTSNAMNQIDAQTKKDFLYDISRHLMINASFMDDLGLYHGKMGVVLYFAHFARYSQKDIYNDFASKLLDEIYAEIHTDTPINFKNGLCGIGWGMEYLLQNGFLEGNSNEILHGIDEKIMERDPRRMQDKQFETGAEGILYYVVTRLTSPQRPTDDIPFDPMYLQCWKEVLEWERANSPEGNPPPHPLLRWMNGEEVTLDLTKFMNNLISSCELQDNEYMYLPFGLSKGSAGMGLKNILL